MALRSAENSTPYITHVTPGQTVSLINFWPVATVTNKGGASLVVNPNSRTRPELMNEWELPVSIKRVITFPFILPSTLRVLWALFPAIVWTDTSTTAISVITGSCASFSSPEFLGEGVSFSSSSSPSMKWFDPFAPWHTWPGPHL